MRSQRSRQGMYQCIYCSSFDTEKELACKLLDQVEKNGYTIAGDYLCETIVETPIFEKDERGMFLAASGACKCEVREKIVLNLPLTLYLV